MNIESLVAKIDLFDDLVIESGFKRDITDFIQSIQQGQNQNLVFMKDLSNKVKSKLSAFNDFGLDSEMKILLRDTNSFIELNTIEKLEILDSNNEINGQNYFSQFNQILNQLKKEIEANEKELVNIYSVFEKYLDSDDIETGEQNALISLVFKDLKTTGTLKEFAKVLTRWNRVLLVYHTLLKSDSPDEIELIEIQNGSIDVIFNIDFDIALDLTELLKVGLKAYGGYLLYKSTSAKLIIETYMGNRKLIAQEKEREKLLLENIKESISNKALEQHKERLKTDKKIDKTSVDKKIDEVSKVLTDHLIKGNEMKLLTDVENNNEEEDISTELRNESAKVRENFKKLSHEDKQLLLETYSIKEDSPE